MLTITPAALESGRNRLLPGVFGGVFWRVREQLMTVTEPRQLLTAGA